MIRLFWFSLFVKLGYQLLNMSWMISVERKSDARRRNYTLHCEVRSARNALRRLAPIHGGKHGLDDHLRLPHVGDDGVARPWLRNRHPVERARTLRFLALLNDLPHLVRRNANVVLDL